MLKILQSLFGFTDRMSVANERSAKASEDIAVMMEALRDGLAAKLGWQPEETAPALTDDSEGKKRRKSA